MRITPTPPRPGAVATAAIVGTLSDIKPPKIQNSRDYSKCRLKSDGSAFRWHCRLV
ncbi:predicted protein [Neisseria gonorrhoeae SK-93-1035]|nr:predicted protein [Neisseria gonorrhoeae PID18]EEZ53892.1 predicted protein [Neisseria gonorrhoeae PID332]EEZ58372.1 predicted protein [Neisseria gonorrhoeae SK-93-1035]